MKRLANILLNVVLIGSGVLAVALLGFPVVIGAKPIVVLSGSMEPVLKVGGVALMERVDPTTLQVGDIITFRLNDDPKVMVTHRIIEVIQQPTLTFQTQGDAVKKPDPFTVPAEHVVGRVRYSMPVVGYVMHSIAKDIRTPLGFGITMGLTSVLLVGSEVRNIVSSVRGRHSSFRKRRTARLKKRWPRMARRLA